jgi:aspartate aminotransferase
MNRATAGRETTVPNALGESPVASRQLARAVASIDHILRFFTASSYSRVAGDASICDFVAGNPQDLAMPAFVDAVQRAAAPRDKNWFAYSESIPAAQAALARGLTERSGVTFEPSDVLLTGGAFGALAVLMHSLLDPGDEVIFLSPPWFFYESLILAYGGVPVRVGIDHATWEPDVAAIRAAITPRTRALIVNTPNNPTGKIYSRAELGATLAEGSAAHGRPIYLISDESYCRILFDGNAFHAPAASYDHTIAVYTYGKTLLTPGERLGCMALPATMPNREALREALFAGQVLHGYAFPNTLLQHALSDLESLTVDIARLARRRDRLVKALRDIGYELHVPEATFYLLPTCPIADDQAFIEILARHNVYCLAGTIVEMPGRFRISVTASDEMVERSLAGFEAAFQEAAA